MNKENDTTLLFVCVYTCACAYVCVVCVCVCVYDSLVLISSCAGIIRARHVTEKKQKPNNNKNTIKICITLWFR